MDASYLSYPGGHFDYIIGFEALHHVILHPNIPSELNRVLRMDGKIIFAENYGQNPVFEMYRKLITMRKAKSKDRGEVTLRESIVVKKFGKYFDSIDIFPQSLVYMIKKKVKNRLALKSMYFFDHIILRIFPSLKEFCGESVIVISDKK